MSDWVWWVLVVALFGIGEILTQGFFLAPFAIGALGGMLAAFAGAGTAVQIVIFLVASGAASLTVRPIARRHITMPPQIRTGTAALIGAQAMVLERVGAHEGKVRIGGEVWTARSYMEDEVFEPGTEAHIVEIRGATALVSE